MSVYEGKSKDKSDVSVLGLGGSVVLNMICFLRTPELPKIYFGNFFTSIRLMKELSEMRVRATGTAPMNQVNNCPIESENSMKKKLRGTYNYRFEKNTEIMAVMWKDNNCVMLLSNLETVHPVSQVKRWSKAEDKEVQDPQQRMISECNNHIGGVDKLHWNLQKSRVRIRGKKWYLPLFTNILDVALISEHIIYCLSNENIPLLQIRRMVAREYFVQSSAASDPKRAGRPSYQKSTFHMFQLNSGLMETDI
ncbi:piggyBac transposable element-derived protein 3-like [Schistocerca americana]|uniref:piggyBac transposable element-derived protein 3-like n=1 Tax=Schistocerca americana TaxID=7009 RepID=UPI001F4F9632|nr:piggyBac transposable element-derived protein 3-like [Schistocerca americana]